jgi:hypothetical protein
MSTTGLMEFRPLESDKDLNDQIHEELDGAFYEVVKLRHLPRPFIMLVDDCGAIKPEVDINPLASELYGIKQHGQPIFGTALIFKENIVDGEPHIVGLDEDDTSELISILRRFFVIWEVNG